MQLKAKYDLQKLFSAVGVTQAKTKEVKNVLRLAFKSVSEYCRQMQQWKHTLFSISSVYGQPLCAATVTEHINVVHVAYKRSKGWQF